MKPGTDAALSLLQHKRIYFGHQSVGANILDGVRALCRAFPAHGLNIVDTSRPEDFASPVFGHSSIGRNQDPRSKIDAFAEIMGKGLGNKADIAFFKFCYVDVTDGSDVTGLFNYYRAVMAQLAAAFPQTRLLHVTVPVTVMPDLLRRVIGRLRQRRNRVAYDNLARAEYNRLLTQAFAGKDPVFDLAAAESITDNGRMLRHTLQGREFRTLVPAYSSDGRHLSETGQRVVAAALLDALANSCTPVATTSGRARVAHA